MLELFVSQVSVIAILLLLYFYGINTLLLLLFVYHLVKLVMIYLFTNTSNSFLKILQPKLYNKFSTNNYFFTTRNKDLYIKRNFEMSLSMLLLWGAFSLNKTNYSISIYLEIIQFKLLVIYSVLLIFPYHFLYNYILKQCSTYSKYVLLRYILFISFFMLLLGITLFFIK